MMGIDDIECRYFIDIILVHLQPFFGRLPALFMPIDASLFWRANDDASGLGRLSLRQREHTYGRRFSPSILKCFRAATPGLDIMKSHVAFPASSAGAIRSIFRRRNDYI